MIKKFLRRASSAMLALLLALLLVPQTAQAAGASLSGSDSIQAGNTVSLTLSVPNSVYGLTADLSYSSNLSFTNYNCSVSGWSILVNNNKFSVYGTSSSSGGIIVVKLKVSGSAKAGDALSASFSNIVVSDGNSDTDLGTASWSGKVGAAPSGDCALSSLSCGNATLSPSFSSKTTFYTCTVPFAVSKLDLNYKKSDSNASVSVSGNDELAVGVNTVTITVKAANGETRTYTIEVTREQDPNYKPSTNGKLSSLTIEGASLSPQFSSTVTDYIAYVPYETTSITLAAETADEKAKGRQRRRRGEAATLEVGVHGIHPELVRLLGRMRFRTSYGQNALKHSIEVAQLSGLLAGEIGCDIKLAKRAGLLHDIGKSIDHEIEGSHVQIGVDLCRKYKESPTVINAVASHHGDVEPESLIACIVQAADTISAARPGARRETLETYTNRLKQLEDITNSFKGVEKSFAIQAGREIRVMVIPEVVSDSDMVLMARDISKQIESQMEYPGQIKVSVIRESRVVDYAK